MFRVEVKGLHKTFLVEAGWLRGVQSQVRALQGVSLTIDEGESVAIVGGSGCGKSTLAKIISGLYPADSGEVLWAGQPMDTLSREERARRVQMIFQDPFASLNPKLSIGVQIADVIRVRKSNPSESEVLYEAKQLLESVRLPVSTLEHYPYQFSGGQRQRIAIARALAMKPALLIADEPLSALDVTVQSQIVSLLAELKRELKLTLVFITHDLAVLPSIADRTYVMKEGQIIEEGKTDALLHSPSQAYTQALLQAVPRLPC